MERFENTNVKDSIEDVVAVLKENRTGNCRKALAHIQIASLFIKRQEIDDEIFEIEKELEE